MNKSFFRFFKGFCISIILILFLESIYFVWILNLENSEIPSDIILIFKGGKTRTEAGYRLANLGVASRIILSPASEAHLQQCAKEFQLRETVTSLYENQARTTFENALYTSRIIKSNKFKSVTLVTSDYHMPRSLAMLRLLLMGKGVRVQGYQVDGRDLSGDSTVYNITFMKLIYNEMVEFWGSLFEYVAWYVADENSENLNNNGSLFLFLRSLVLLDIEPEW